MKKAPEEFRNARILIVDDEQQSAELLARMLERAGYAICITISDPTVAASRFCQIDPDIVLLDLHMEPINGVDVLKHISAALLPHERPPVLMLTEPRWKTQAMGKGIAIDIQLELETTPRIWGHASELREVLTNLIFNAVDAMPAGGSLTFHTGIEDDFVILSVKDSGIGMPDEVRRRCLEPFFTTKGEHGSGLGLAMVYGIVQRHRGEMEILSKAGHGTTFMLRFPASIAADQDTCPASGTAVERSLRVLVVEDQELIRKIIVNNLGDDLHDITTAANADEALDILATEDFDLVVTDQAMPGMNGVQLADAIKRISPETRVILLTGFGTESQDGHEGSGVDLVLEKPISQAAFRTAVAQVMSTAHRAPDGRHEPARELSQTA